MAQSRYWCFTINNPKDDIVFLPKHMTYLVYQYEIAPETGTRHIQGFVVHNKVVRMTAIKKFYPTAHIERMRGSSTEASDYCKKIDSREPGTEFHEFGKCPLGSGQRTDLQAICDSINENKSCVEFKYTATYVRNKRNIDQLVAESQPDRTFKPEVHWIYGSSGTGKTRYVYDFAVENHLTVWPGNKCYDTFWNGYDNQDIVLMDDFRYDHCEFTKLLEYLDRYPCNVDVKGGFRKLNSKYIMIVSNNSPKEVYKFNVDEEMKQLCRRIDKVFFKTEEGMVDVTMTPEEQSRCFPIFNRSSVV